MKTSDQESSIDRQAAQDVDKQDADAQESGFDAVKKRLAEIADAVDDEGLSLDDALDLYEEAVSLGLQASDLLEVGIDVEDEPADGKGDPASEGDADGREAVVG